MSQDFGKGKIYKITNDYNDDVYVGSTCDLLTKRFSNHKGDHRKERCKNIPIYKLMNEIGFERFRIELIEEYPSQDKYQLRQREGHFIREIGTLNKLIAGRTRQESQKEYYEINKEHLNEVNREYNKKYYQENKEKKQEYRNNYKEMRIEYDKEYNKANKNKIHEKRSLKITCECGSIFGKCDISRHKKTNKHQEYIKAIQTEVAH